MTKPYPPTQENTMINNSIQDAIGAATAQAAAAERDGEKPDIARVPRKSLADFKRDTDGRNVLIKGRWGVRGSISMHVSTTGSGKSVLQTQSALCFNRGIACCGLEPTRPFKTWVIQSEDDDDRVAIDRDDIAAYLAERHPTQDWNTAMRETAFLDFTGITGVSFIETLNNELNAVKDSPDEKPDAIILNPWNKFFGGDPMSHKDCSAFLAGGELGRGETEGIEAVVKRHGVWLWVFSHTGKPPTRKDLKDWLADPYSCYKMCGSSAVPDAVRSIITFLKVPDHDGVFTFTAGKNGAGLGWTDTDGNRTNRGFFQWGEDERHYWRDVEKSMYADMWDAPADTQGDRKTNADKYNAANAEMRKCVIEAIERAGTESPLATCAVEDALKVKGYTERPIKNLLKLLKTEKREGEERCVIEEQRELMRNAKRELVNKPRGATFLFTPELKDAYLRRWGCANA